MPWIDGHLDLAYLGVSGHDLTRPHEDPASGCISLPELREAGVTIAFGTIYTEPEATDSPWGYPDSADREAAFATGKRQLDLYHQLADQGEIRLIRSAADLEQPAPAPGVVLLMEGADPIRSPDDVGWWHERGVRLVGLTWALGTRYAGGNERHGPLSDEGRELVRELDRFGIIHDVSHLADAAFADLLKTTDGPIVATHSNCRALLPDRQRHLTDDQIRAIAARDGVVGLNLCGYFLSQNDDRATIDDCIAHVEHV
ncbi:MAG: peptidase M19, partial [Phycisphaerales bacterium]